MTITRQALEEHPSYKNLPESDKAFVRRKIYNAAVRPQFAGRGASKESRASLIEWGLAEPTRGPVSIDTNPVKSLVRQAAEYTFDQGPIGQVRRTAQSAWNAAGLPDPELNPLSPNFGKPIKRTADNEIIPDAIPAEGLPTYMGAVGQFGSMVLDPSNKLIIGKGLAAAKPVANAAGGVIPKAIVGAKMAAKPAAITGAAVGGGTEALRQLNEHEASSLGGVAGQGLAGGLLGGTLGAAMGAARGIGGPSIQEELLARGLSRARFTPEHALVPVGPVRDTPRRAATPEQVARTQAAMDANALRYTQQGNSLAPSLRMGAAPEAPRPQPLALPPGPRPLALPPPRSGPILPAEPGNVIPLGGPVRQPIAPQPLALPESTPIRMPFLPHRPESPGMSMRPIERMIAIKQGELAAAEAALVRSKKPGAQAKAKVLRDALKDDIAALREHAGEVRAAAPAKNPATPKAPPAAKAPAPETLPPQPAPKQPTFTERMVSRAPKPADTGATNLRDMPLGQVEEHYIKTGDEGARRLLADAGWSNEEMAALDARSPKAPAPAEGAVEPAAPSGQQTIPGFDRFMKLADRLEANGQRIVKNTRGRLRSGVDVDALSGHAQILAARLIRGGVKFGTWAREMVGQHGEAISPHLRRIWNEATALADDLRARGATPSEQSPAAGLADELASAPRSATGAKFAGNVNLDRVTTPDEVKAVYEATARHFAGSLDEARRGTLTDEAVKGLARDLGFTVQDLQARRRGQAFNAEEVMSAREIVASSATRVESRARELADAVERGAATERDRLDFLQAVELHVEVQKQAAGIAAEAGRALRAHGIQAKSQKARIKEIDEIIRNFGGKGAVDNLAAKIAEDPDPAKVAEATREFVKPGVGSMIEEYYRNSIMSAPSTFEVNAIGNMITTAGSVAESLAAAGIGKARGSNAVHVGEARARIFAFMAAQKEAAHAAKLSFKNEAAVDPLGNVVDDGFTPAIPGKAGKLIRLPGRINGAGDSYAKALLFKMEANALAYRKAAGEGLAGEALNGRVAELLAKPPDDLFDAALKASRYHTMSDPFAMDGPLGWLDALGVGAMLARKNIPLGGIAVPFIKYPVKSTKYVIERTPLALLSPKLQKVVRTGLANDATQEQAAAADEILARVAVGTITMAMFGALARAGVITGNGPSDWRENKALVATGWKPQAIKVGDQYYSYQRLEPVASLAALAADFATLDRRKEVMEAQGAEKAMQAAKVLMAGFVNNLGEKTYLKSVADLMDALRQPERFAERYTGNLAAGFIPNALNRIEQGTDPLLRDTKSDTAMGTIGNKMAARVPGLASKLPAQTDPFGAPIKREMGGAEAMLSPILRSKENKDPVLAELARMGKNLPEPPRDMDPGPAAVKLTQAQRREYKALVGPVEKRALGRVVASAGYRSLKSDEERWDVIQYVTREARKYAREQFLAGNGAQLRAQIKAQPATTATK